MNTLPSLYANPGLPARLSRRIDRQHALIEANADLTRHVDRLRVSRLMQVAEQSQMAVAHLSAAEAVLVQGVPHAEARLRQITDAATIGLARIVLEAGGVG